MRASWSTSPATRASRCWSRCAAPTRSISPSSIQPTAVSLDVFLPDMLGWTVLSQLKQNPLTRHIPVQIITLDEDRQHGAGARRLLLRHQADHDRRRRRGAGADQGIRQAAPQAAAGRRGQRRRADEHRASCSATTTSRSSPPAPASEALDDAARAALRLRRARSAAAGHVRLRRAGADPRRRRAVRCAGRGLHRPGAVGRGGRAAAHHGAQHRGQGRGIARAAARRNRAVPASGRHRTAAREAADAGAAATAPTRIWSAARCCWSTTTRATSSRCRSVLERRGMQVLTATTGSEAIALVESTPDLAIVLMDIMMPEMDGYQTMEVIREQAELPPAADHRADRQGDEGRPREMPGGRRLRLSGQAGQHRAAAVGAAHVAASVRRSAPMTATRQGQHPAGRRPAGEAAELRGHPAASSART